MDCLLDLMVNVLGYDKFCIQGGDWGSMIGTRISYKYPDNILGLHLNMLALRRDYEGEKFKALDEKDYNLENDMCVITVWAIKLSKVQGLKL